MGSGIAAHLSNLGFEVTLLDLTLESVHAAFDRARSARPPHFMTSERAEAIRLGSIQDNLAWVSDADWVCEAIIEKPDAKKALFAQLEPLLRPDAMITTNTSGLEIGLLAEGLGDSFRRRFVGTHFFNPPRYLKLLELIPTPDTDPESIEAISRFLEDRVARRVVVAKDTPGFIANRFGMWSMIHAIHVTEKLQLAVEEVDAITGPFLGRPRSASFRLNDLVGLDIMADIAHNLRERCPHDPQRKWLELPQSMITLMSRGWIGDKAARGYYAKEGKELMAFDLTTNAYRMRREAKFPEIEAIAKLPLGERISHALEQKSPAGDFLRNHLVPVLRYADSLKEEISHSVLDFDRVMMWGFGWEKGPFAMIDAIGPEKLGLPPVRSYQDGTQRTFEGTYISVPSEPQYRKVTDFPIVETREGFNVRDLGDGVVALALTSKMGTINPTNVRSMTEFLQEGSAQRLVLTSESRSYSAGFDLNFFAERIQAQDWDGIDQSLKELQELARVLRSFSSVACVFGHCLGAGMELAMGCSIVAASSESSLGLPEAKVGLIPGGGGTVFMRLRSQDSAKRMADGVVRLVLGLASACADDARQLGLLRDTDKTLYHPDRLLADAKELALSISPRPLPEWSAPEGPVSAMIEQALKERRAKGDLTDYDLVIGDKLRSLFVKSGSVEEAFERERAAFVELCHHNFTLARIKAMLESGKPLRN